MNAIKGVTVTVAQGVSGSSRCGVNWIDVAKVALSVYLAVSVGYIVVVYRRRRRSRPAVRPVPENRVSSRP